MFYIIRNEVLLDAGFKCLKEEEKKKKKKTKRKKGEAIANKSCTKARNTRLKHEL